MKQLLSNLWNRFRSSKFFKPLICLLIVFVLVKATDLFNSAELQSNQSETENSPQGNSENTEEQEEENDDSKPTFHIGTGHIVMFCVFAGGYAIDKAILFHNKKMSDKKYQ